MKNSVVILLLAVSSLNTSGQVQQKEAATKMEAFASKTGAIIKFVDYSLPTLSLIYGAAEAKVRKIISGGEVQYFYQVSAKGQYSEKSGSIAYGDLLEIIKALQTLKTQAITDASSDGDYLENKFVTSDGFQVGYYVSKGKVKWYLVVDRYGSDNTIFVNDVATIDRSFVEAKNKIEQLKE